MPGTQFPSADRGNVTSAATAALITVTLGFRAGYVQLTVNSGGTNPDIITKNDAATDRVTLVTGSTGVITKLTDANSITITDNGFTVAAGVQTDSGENEWLAVR